MTPGAITTFVEEFERRVWGNGAGFHSDWTAEFERRCVESGIELDAVVKAQNTDVLALALRGEVFFRRVFEELMWIRFRGRMTRWFEQFGADPHTAEDLAAEILLGVYRNPREGRSRLGGYDPAKAPFSAYLRAVARHLYVSRVVRKRRPGLAGHVLERPGGDATTVAAVGNEFARRAEDAIARLDEPGRTVMRLTVEGWPPADIAGETRLTIRSVYQLLHKVRRRLAPELAADLPPARRGRPRNSMPVAGRDGP